MVTGKDLFTGEPHEIAGLHVYHDPKPELEAAPITPDLKRILEHALKKDFTARFVSWQELLEDLDDYQANVLASMTRRGRYRSFPEWRVI